jgi:hypothetical protein
MPGGKVAGLVYSGGFLLALEFDENFGVTVYPSVKFFISFTLFSESTSTETSIFDLQ